MRILLALGTSTGGVGRHVHDLAAALASRGEHVVVAAPEEVLEQFAFAGVAERVEVLSVTDRPHPRKDVATVGGAVAGAAIGANVGRDNETSTFQDVQRCERVAGPARPQYWDATYYFRGVEHRVQLASPPGPTITVNERGEPRW